MRRIFLAIFCLFLLPLPGQAAQRPCVALTFDDGPSGRFTRALLEGLEQRSVRATFFLCGYRIRENPALAEAIRQAGHEVGSHGDSHRPMTQLSPEALRRELQTTQALLGGQPVLLRPPGGLYDEAVCQAAREAGLALVLWSVDPRDWAGHDVRQITRQVVEQVRSGDIILMHDMSDSSVEAALQIVDELTARGFCFGTVSQLARQRGTELLPGQVYRRFP